MNAFEDQGFHSSPTVAITGSGSAATGTAAVRSETGAGTSIWATAGGKDSALRGFVKKRAVRTTTNIAKIRPTATVHRPTAPPVFTGLSETPGMWGISGLNRSFCAGELGWSGMNAITEVRDRALAILAKLHSEPWGPSTQSFEEPQTLDCRPCFNVPATGNQPGCSRLVPPGHRPGVLLVRRLQECSEGLSAAHSHPNVRSVENRSLFWAAGEDA